MAANLKLLYMHLSLKFPSLACFEEKIKDLFEATTILHDEVRASV